MIKFDFSTYNKIDDFSRYNEKLINLKAYLANHDEQMGWAKPELLFNEDKIFKIKEKALFIKENCDVFLVVGIGGSFMGTKAIIDALRPYFIQTVKPKVVFVGNSLSSEYLSELLTIIENKEVIINVISKSGNTLEVLTTYDILLSKMKEKYNDEELKKRIIITTEPSMGNTLFNESKEKGFEIIETFKNIGGRFSVFTESGLLPICVADIDINGIINGAKEALKDYNNPARYAIIRDIMINKGFIVEAFTAYEPKLAYFIEWLKQLYGESLGKKGKGALPYGVINTRDLHSLGQYIQEGPKIIFETLFVFDGSKYGIYSERYQKNLSEINNIAYQAVARAHFEDGVNSSIFEMDELNEFNIGYLFQFFMISVTISGFIEENDEVFTQDGVEKYKNILNGMLKK